MKKFKSIYSLLTLVPAQVLHIPASAIPAEYEAAQKPNIIVIYTDDHGYADLSCQGILEDIKTPNIDSLARHGVRAVNGYTTAPQCVPSRAGLLTGKSQNRFGLESNDSALDGFDAEQTIADRLKQAGYVTAQFGKWHLGATAAITSHGFDHVFSQNANRPFNANITLGGADRPMGELNNEMYHIDGCSYAASSIIKRYADSTFFLYVAYRAPHVPLDATEKYLSRFPGEMPERRRQALAMISAVDDGVGLIVQTLKEEGIFENTLIFLIGDNGAPLKIHKADEPLTVNGGWDGSLNDPLNGEKGMLTEGGIHVPFIISWKGKIPGGQVYQHPVSTLDVAATVIELAGLSVAKGELDGVNLIPYLTGENPSAPHEALMWRWIAQSAIREGKWKLLRGGSREYLFDLEADLEEENNLAPEFPEIAEGLRGKLEAWTMELDPPGLTTGPMAATWNDYYDYYLEGGKSDTLCYHEWHFEDLDNWILNERLTGSVSNGVAMLTITGVDPFMTFNKKVCIDAGKSKFLKISAKNNTDKPNAALYFKNDVTNTFKYQGITLSQNDEQLKKYIIDLSANADWIGNILSIRFDPPGSSGTFDLDYIIISDHNFPVSTDRSAPDRSFEIFPNPAREALWIKSIHPSTIEIFNLQGAKICNLRGHSDLIKMDISHMRRGFYIIKVSNDQFETIQKLILE